MMGRFRFFLNGIQLKDEPQGWEDFTESIVRDDDLHGITLQYESDLVLMGDGYKIVNELFLSTFCAEIIFTVDQKCGGGEWNPLLRAMMRVTDTDTNLQKCMVTIKVTDDSFYGRIYNNRDIPVNLKSNKTKNEEDIVPCNLIDLKIFNPRSLVLNTNNVAYLASAREAYDHRDVLTYILAFITDNQITEIKSDYLDALQFSLDSQVITFPYEFTNSSFFLTVGSVLRKAGNDVLITTFQDLIKTLFSTHNLMWFIRDGIFIIEPSTFFQSDRGREFPNTRDLERSVDTRKLFAKVSLGSEVDLKDRDLVYAMPYLELLSHELQEYSVKGNCNTDAVLDLTTPYVYSSNVIEDVLVKQSAVSGGDDPDQTHDDDIFYIQAVYVPSLSQWFSVYSTQLSRPNVSLSGLLGITYNPFLYNVNILARFTLPGGIFVYQADGSDEFRATYENGFSGVERITSPPTALQPWPGGFGQWQQLGDQLGAVFGPAWGSVLSGFPITDLLNIQQFPVDQVFDNDSTDGNFDPNDNWDENKYTAAATGLYGFKCVALWNKLSDLITPQPGGVPIPIANHPFPNQQYLHYTRGNAQCVYQRYNSSDELIDSTIAPSEEQLFFDDLIFTPVYGVGSIVSTSVFGGNPPTIPLLHRHNKAAGSIGQRWNFPIVRTYNQLVYLEVGDYMKVIFRARMGKHVPIDNYQTGPTSTIPGDLNRTVRYGLEFGSSMETSYVLTGGADFGGVDEKLHLALKYFFGRPTTKEQWDEMKKNVDKSSGISISQMNIIDAFVSKITRNLATGATEFELIGNRDQTYF